jgi:UDP-N-acetylglucosamine--N-acetylmuramyl-(pentapeptide) pyrophosphoryl-undecaprenol N-acetylglucosamine transferase
LTIVLTGGGSGGHITPILAVAEQLKKTHPESKLIYIGQKGDGLIDIPSEDPNIDKVYTIMAGKFRRFHGEGFKQLLDLPTIYKNLRDLIYIIAGLCQSWKLIDEIKPDIVFSRGGYVSVPVALGAHLRHVPYITHDSDPIPSLANRIIARWAAVHAVALPEETYPYPIGKTINTGIPVSRKFVSVNDNLRDNYRKKIGIPENAKLLFVVGGGLGSQRINNAVAAVLPHLMKEIKDLYVVHGVGRLNETEMKEFYDKNLDREEQGRLRTFGYLGDLYLYSGAADVIVTRAGATNLAEFALQGKACIVVPSAFLVAGHQLKNAEFLEDRDAALVMDEASLLDDPNRLAKQLSDLLKDKKRQNKLGENLAEFAKPDSAQEIAKLIIKTGTDSETTKKKG